MAFPVAVAQAGLSKKTSFSSNCLADGLEEAPEKLQNLPRAWCQPLSHSC